MQFYLSSFNIGNRGNKLKELIKNKKICYIPNAIDNLPDERIKYHIANNIKSLKLLGLEPEVLDLKRYFGKPHELEYILDDVQAVWINGGNTFVLRQAMKLSGFDSYIQKHLHTDFVYAGFSAALCILYKDMKALQIVDEPYVYPYEEIKDTIWEGLEIVDYMLLPHYDSDHYESDDIAKEVEYCKNNNVPYKTLKDGEVIIIEIKNR